MPANNPSPYRLFSAPSNTTSSQKPKIFQTPSRPPPSSFVAPSSTATPSQFARTPRFAATPSARHAITQIEDLETSTPPLPSSEADSTSATKPSNDIEDDLDHLDSTGRSNESGTDDEFDDLISRYEKRRGTKHITGERPEWVARSTDIDSDHARKRRKTHDTKRTDAISISSQSSDDLPLLSSPSHASEDLGEAGDQAPLSEDGFVPKAKFAPAQNEGTTVASSVKSTVARFQNVAGPTPFSPPPIVSRPSFVRPPGPSRALTAAATQGTSILLPDAFSPSKRRGRGKEYLPHGLAETMVDWILVLGQEEEARKRQLQQRPGQSQREEVGPGYERIVHVVEMKNDSMGRGLFVRGHDNAVYLLTGNSASTGKVVIGSRVGLRRGQLSWSIELSKDSQPDAPALPPEELVVSALWDLDPT